MSQLVPVPYQRECYLTPDTLALLQAVNARLGTQLAINGADGAWRSYARQAYLYNGYIKGLPGFNTASNPDTGQRNHMRGAAFDLVRTDKAAQDACRAVGLIRDSAEPWHWNNPNWANMPIIPTLPGAVIAGDGTVISINGGFLMALTDSEQAEVLNGVRNLYSGFFVGGPSMADGGKALVKSIAELRALLAPATVTRTGSDGFVTVAPGGKPIAQTKVTDDAQTGTIARAILAKLDQVAAPVIDYDALAAAVVRAGGTGQSAEEVAAAVAKLLGSKLGA